MSAEQEFREWEKREREQKGLVDIKVYWGDLTGATIESVCAELNAVNRVIEAGLATPFPDSF